MKNVTVSESLADAIWRAGSETCTYYGGRRIESDSAGPDSLISRVGASPIVPLRNGTRYRADPPLT